MNPALAALIVHDLKNGLGALEGQLLDLARDCPAAGPVQRHCLDLRQRFVQFLTLYGIDGCMRAHSTDENPVDLLHLMAIQQAPLLAPLKLEVLDADLAPPFGFFDRRLVRLALEAALHNAGRYARSQVTLRARSDGEHLVFVVDDDGPGLQTPDPDDPVSTGLGTALCEAVAHAHDLPNRRGEVRLFNRPFSSGARFELWLP